MAFPPVVRQFEFSLLVCMVWICNVIFAHSTSSIPMQTVPLTWTYVSSPNTSTYNSYSLTDTWLTDAYSFPLNDNATETIAPLVNPIVEDTLSNNSIAIPQIEKAEVATMPNIGIDIPVPPVQPKLDRRASSAMPWKTTDRLDDVLLNMNSFRSDSPRGVVKESVKRKKKNLFRSFAFKGVAFSVSKSVMDFKGIGVGVKVPVTANFPEYDKLIYLPKVVAFVGVNYPFSCRFQIAFSVPAQVVVAILMMLFKREKVNWSQLKASGSVKRVGVNWALNYNKKNGLHTVMSCMLFYIPGMRTVIDLLPVIIVFPAVIIGLWNLLIQVLAEVGFDPLKKGQAHMENAKGTNTFGTSNELSEEINSILSTSFSNAWVLVDKWMRKKTPIFGSNIGYNAVKRRMSLASSVYFDIQPFFPLQNRWKRFSTERTKQNVKVAANVARTAISSLLSKRKSFLTAR